MTTIALIGCAHIHIRGFGAKLAKRAGLTVKYVWDPTPERAEHWSKQLAAKIIASPSRALRDKDVQAVVICSETNRHQRLVLDAAKAGKHMFVEKPLGMRARDCNRMADAIREAGVMFQTGYFNRCRPVHRFIRDQIGRGRFGTITRIRAANCHSAALGGWFDFNKETPALSFGWMADPKIAGCGAFGDLGTHLLDIMMWLLGDVESVTGVVKPVVDRYHNGCDETGEAMLQFKSGAIGVLAGAWVDVANPVSLQVCGTEAHASVINGELFFTCPAMTGADGKQPWTDLPPELPHAFDQFLDALEGKPAELVSVDDAASRVAVMEAIYKGAAKQRWVNVS